MTTVEILDRIVARLEEVSGTDLFQDAAAEAVAVLHSNWTDWEEENRERHSDMRAMATADIDRTIDALEGLRAHILSLFS